MRQINLLAWRSDRRRKNYGEMALYFLLPLLLAGFSLLFFYGHEQKMLQSCLQQKHRLVVEFAKLKLKEQQQALVKRRQLSENHLWELFVYMGSLLPKGLSIQEWQYQHRLMQWDGEALDNTSIQILTKNLCAISFLHSVHIKQISKHNFIVEADYVDGAS